METIKVIITGRWVWDGVKYEKGDVVELPKEFHDALVKQGFIFDYPKVKKDV
jgi:hypothetical protein